MVTPGTNKTATVPSVDYDHNPKILFTSGLRFIHGAVGVLSICELNAPFTLNGDTMTVNWIN